LIQASQALPLHAIVIPTNWWDSREIKNVPRLNQKKYASPSGGFMCSKNVQRIVCVDDAEAVYGGFESRRVGECLTRRRNRHRFDPLARVVDRVWCESGGGGIDRRARPIVNATLQNLQVFVFS
jgi:hypothetical protein